MTVNPLPAMGGNRIAILLMIAAIALSLSTSIGHLISFDSIALDFGVFHRVPRTDAQFLYRPGDAPFVYPPSAIAAFAPLALVPFWPGYVVWTVVSAAVFAAAAWRLAGGRVALLSFLSAGAIEGLVLGQVSMLLSGLVLWAITLQPFRRGLLLGIVACIKPQLLLLAPLIFLVRRDWPTLLGMLAGATAALLASLALFGTEAWLDWARSFSAFHDALVRIKALAQVVTPVGFAETRGYPAVPVYVASVLVAAGAAILGARRYDGVFLAALIVGTSILASPYAMRHDLIAVIPACVVAIFNRPSLKSVPALALFAGWAPALALVVMAAAQFFQRPWPRLFSADVRPG